MSNKNIVDNYLKLEKDDNIIDFYLKLTKKYKSEYGDQTVLLLQVGSFFEVYGLLDKNTKEISSITSIKEISQICNLNIAEKKISYDGYGIVMCGYRDYCNEKYLQKITENDYTAIVYIQEKNGKEVIRKLHSINSPGTYISYEVDTNPQITNNIMCIWFELTKPMSSTTSYQQKLIYGVSVINIFTGESFLFEHECIYHMNPTIFDELERCISVFSPSEILLISPFHQKELQKIIQYSGIKTKMVHYIKSDDLKNEKVQNCIKQKYIAHILKTFFNEDTYNIHYEFNEYTVATQSFCYLLNFVQEHDPNLVRKIHIPKFNNSSNRMILANHTLMQLNIINDQVGKQYGNLSSVLTFLNKCMTSMGRRMFQYQLTNPTFDEYWLQNEYNMISYMISIPNFSDIIGELRRQLQGIKDIEKNCRQIISKKIYPSSLYNLYFSIEIIQKTNEYLKNHPKICDYLVDKEFSLDPYKYINDTCIDILQFLNENLDIEICRGITTIQTFTENIIKPGISKDLDDCISIIQTHKNAFYTIRDYLTVLLKRELKMKEGDEYIKIHETEKSGKSLQITSKRAASLRSVITDEKKIQPIMNINSSHHEFKLVLDDIKFSKSTSTSEEIHSPLIKNINHTIVQNEEKMNSLISEVYLNIVQQLESRFFQQIENLCKYIAKLDVLITKVYVANKYNYCCPIIEKNENISSFVDFKEIRHVLIEQINQNELYVTNDMNIGDQNIKGILLFGTNAVGKTSFIRAIGIAIIMAQSGMFVPCSYFKYKPYRSIFSRILSNDNLFKGLSTFAVEMSELRVILKMSDQYSLILGDELASGTETESALSIFAAALIELNRKQCTYMFATHFHEITEFDEIKQIKTLVLKHLSVKYDRELDCLIYDRKLKDGQGDRIYGLEVCMSFSLPKEIMDMAFELRSKYFVSNRGELSYKSSHFNSNKIRGVCELCNKEPASEIHHLIPQIDADSNGFIGTFHKNNVANLASICEKCHQNIHHSNTNSSKNETVKMVRKKTTKGVILQTFNNDIE